jgi:hypothetical protein
MNEQIDIFGNEISATELAKQFQETEQKHRRRYKPMQELYGLTQGKTCKTCKHCLKINYHCKTYYKCDLWFISNSEATDIRLKNNACGKYESESDTE